MLTSPDNVHEKTANPKIIKGAAKKHKMTSVSVSSFFEKNSSNPIEEGNNVCWKNYFLTKKKKADWIKCSSCQKWLHETCTMYTPHCNTCGKEILPPTKL